jgi:hypothetical protein
METVRNKFMNRETPAIYKLDRGGGTSKICDSLARR